MAPAPTHPAAPPIRPLVAQPSVATKATPAATVFQGDRPPPLEPGSVAPAGGTHKAVAGPQPSTEVPEELRGKVAAITVELTIHVNGKLSVHLLGSTGSAVMDQLIEQSWSKWKWRPALKNGRPVESALTVQWESPL
jgi:hypothetical protein